MQTLKSRPRIALLALLLLLANLFGCAQPPPPAPVLAPAVENPTFSRTPPVANWTFRKKAWSEPPREPAQKGNPFAVDLRLADLRGVDLRQSGEVLINHALFDTDTKWPSEMPAKFDPAKIMELGKNPGLGVRALHRDGVTGRGIHVAFLDQTLLLEHEEYAGRILRYDEIGRVETQAAMHGAAVTSLLAGRSTGVAPDVIITYYAVQVSAGRSRTFTYLAEAINRIVDENAKLPDAEKIRVIGAAIGWSPKEEGYEEIDKAVRRARAEGVFVISSSVDKYYAFKFHGLGRHPLADPDRHNSYRPGDFWAEQYYRSPESYQKQFLNGRILVPMDSRTTAAPTGKSAYAFYRQGGWSWSIPYLVGVYAMGLQVRPNLTPDEFYQAALETGWYTEFTHDGKSHRLGPVINPAGIVERLRSL
ncbi:MAG: S8 family serine peptidase [Bacillota bacterium]